MIGLVACSAQKLDRAAAARELYTSDLFRKSLEYCELRCSKTYVLSAKHHLVALDELLEPYNEKLPEIRRMRIPETSREWGDYVAGAITQLHGLDPELLVLAGRDYVMPLLNGLALYQCEPTVRRGHTFGKVHTPLAGLTIGDRLSWLKRELELDRAFREKFLGERSPFDRRPAPVRAMQFRARTNDRARST